MRSKTVERHVEPMTIKHSLAILSNCLHHYNWCHEKLGDPEVLLEALDLLAVQIYSDFVDLCEADEAPSKGLRAVSGDGKES